MTKAIETLIHQMSKDGKALHFNQDGRAYIVSPYRVLVLPYTVESIVGYRKLDHKKLSDGRTIRTVVEYVNKLFDGDYYRKDVTRKLIGDIKEYEKEAKALRMPYEDIKVLYSDGRASVNVKFIKQGDTALHFTGMHSEKSKEPVFYTGKDFDREMYYGRMSRMNYPLYMVLPVNRFEQHEGCKTVNQRKVG